MSAELYSASVNNASLQGTTVGGTKPLHRFIKGQPKITGIVVLVLGLSLFIVSIAIMPTAIEHILAIIPPSVLLGLLFIICGILYILTEHNPTKKTVTISLALSIVTLLVACWSMLHIIPSFLNGHYYYSHYDFMDDNVTEETVQLLLSNMNMSTCVEALYFFYTLVGAIILIVMSALAGAALRSTKSQAIIVMTTTAAESPVE
ncbi:membrane-spanning 4-domains subfamily A member 4A [Larimichthys crocea]|nr:membrane-spanning 4-domains subfamily A member 4A [Larimichthys crocea]